MNWLQSLTHLWKRSPAVQGTNTQPAQHLALGARGERLANGCLRPRIRTSGAGREIEIVRHLLRLQLDDLRVVATE